MPDESFAITPPDPSILERIGRVAYEWSWVEGLLGEFLSYLCKADPGAMYVITRNVATATVADWVKTLLQINFRQGNSVKEILEMLSDIDSIRGQRNTVIHGTWRGHDTAGFAWVRTVKWDRSEVCKEELWSTGDLDELVIEIQQITAILGKLGVKLGFLKTTKPLSGS